MGLEAGRLRVETVVFGGGEPDDEVGPEAETAEQQGYEEKDADDGDVHVEILSQAATYSGYATVGGAAG